MRYKQLIEQAAILQPRVIIEIGTWNGERAVQLLRAAPRASYIGFDLFDTADEDSDKREFNVKSHYTMRAVYQHILQAHPRCHIKLIKGDTNVTFTHYNIISGKGSADLIFIDGGHSVKTIAKDWENTLSAIRPGGIIILDDYYEAMSPETLEKIGCNKLVQSLGPPLEVNILPLADLVKGGGFVKMVKVKVPNDYRTN